MYPSGRLLLHLRHDGRKNKESGEVFTFLASSAYILYLAAGLAEQSSTIVGHFTATQVSCLRVWLTRIHRQMWRS